MAASPGLAVSALAALCGAPVAAADPVPLEDVLVTARKVLEPAHDVPLAIAVIDREQLANGAVDGLDAVAARTAGLYFESMWGGFGSAPVMRGQAQPSAAGDNVGVFVDGVYQANRMAIDVEPLDLERIEVVRGPQSALFGRSTFAGAIHYVGQAPTATPEAGANVDVGTDNARGARGFVSGPLPGVPLLARVAIGTRRADGTERNGSASDSPLGGYDRSAAALSIRTAPEFPWSGALAARLLDARAVHPAVTALTYDQYNCGSRSFNGGPWSYWCGPVPVGRSFDISPGVPDSSNRARQVALTLAAPVAGARLESAASYYDSNSAIYRDFDSSSTGMAFGVCRLNYSCDPAAAPAHPIDRVLDVNAVQRLDEGVEEFVEELRLVSAAGTRLEWLLGATAIRTRDVSRTAFGFARGTLAADERLAALLLATPGAVGPLSRANLALVDDPNSAQVDSAVTLTETRALASFAKLEYTLTERLRLHGEARATWQRIATDSVWANFRPSFGRRIAPLEFRDVTPRFSLDWRAAETFAYLSAAKGSRSGGVNPVPDLPPGEQGFDPETNWTYELGVRWNDRAKALSVETAAYYIDWRHTQIPGFSSSPGVTSLITRNTAGITTRGLELGVEAKLGPFMRALTSYSYTDPRFRAGSEDPGSSGFCGLSASSATSTLCLVGPPRALGPAGGLLVPYVDGNVPGRTPRHQWHAALVFEAPVRPAAISAYGQLDASHQGDVFDRGIDGARYGARTLVDGRFGVRRATWAVEAWVRNATNVAYVRGIATRAPGFFPGMPRPLDLVQGEGRRLGLTLSVHSR